MAFAPITFQAQVDTAGNAVEPTGVAAIAAGASTTVLKTGPGRVARVVVTTAGTATDNATIYDNTAGSGTIVAVIPGGTAVGTNFPFDAPLANGLTVVNVASGPAFTITYS
jgi:hypothetical protein